MAARSSPAESRSPSLAEQWSIRTSKARVTEASARAAVVRACRRLDARGLVAGAEGNVSVRVGSRLIVTPAGARKGEVKASECVAMDIATGAVRGRGMASSEVRMHLAVYRARPSVQAIVHAHPPTATGFAVARRPMPSGALAEVAGVIGPIPLVPYHRPGTEALAVAVAEGMRGANAALLANHGAVTVGSDITAALNLMESLEQAARILVSAHILGGVTELRASEVLELEALHDAGNNG